MILLTKQKGNNMNFLILQSSYIVKSLQNFIYSNTTSSKHLPIVKNATPIKHPRLAEADIDVATVIVNGLNERTASYTAKAYQPQTSWEL